MTQAKGEKSKLKVGFFGSVEGGKTQLVHALLDKERLKILEEIGIPKFSEDHEPTMGVGFNSAPSTIEGCELAIAEMGDQERYYGMISLNAKQFADISVICIDQSNPDSLEKAQLYLEKVKEGNPNTQIIIAVTKTDLKPPKITLKEIDKFKQDNEKYGIGEAPVIMTSARTGDGIQELRKGISEHGDLAKIRKFSDKVGKTIERIEKLKTDNYDLDKSPNVIALRTLKREIADAKDSQTVQAAIDNFTRNVNEETLKVEPLNVRGFFTRLFQAIENWDRSYFADTQAEMQERARFSTQTSLKEQLTSFKEETEEEQEQFRPK